MDCDAAWENKPTFANTQLVSPQNKVWRAEIPYWWRVTTQIWVRLLILLRQISLEARPIRSPTQICVVTRHLYEISAHVSRRKKPWKGVCSRGDKITISSDTGNYYKAKCLLCYVLFPSRTQKIEFNTLSYIGQTVDSICRGMLRNYTQESPPI